MAKPKKGGLGRGLDALFANVEISTDDLNNEDTAADEIKKDIEKDDGNSIRRIKINDIKPNSSQPRKIFEEDKLTELAESIKEHGVIQPVILRPLPEKGYEIVAGERRWRAARIAQLTEIPCIIRELTDEENMLIAIIENMQREDLNPIEEAEGLCQMIEVYGMTQMQVAENVGKSRSRITNSLRLLKLPEKIRTMISEGILSAGHAKALAGLDSEEKQLFVADRVVKEGLSVRQTEALCSGSKEKKKPDKRKNKEKDPDVIQVENELKEILGTRVTVKQKGEKGSLEIEYFSREELDRLIEILYRLK